MAVDDGGKADGAMLAIGELADRIGVPTHVLRYWETRFPELKPLQRSGKRRYYRAADVALAGRIHELLHVKGYTVEGARKALGGNGGGPDEAAPMFAMAEPSGGGGKGVSVRDLIALRQRLADALED
ncbi:MAG: MerR family transcriptional regulator [Sphingopyxis sp.]|nr:MerR family transcriptional regulator [Sphingopyxis sp.]